MKSWRNVILGGWRLGLAGTPRTHPHRQIWDGFAAGLKLGRWRMSLGRDEAELDRLEGSWLGGSCLLQLSEGLRAGSDPFHAHLAGYFGINPHGNNPRRLWGGTGAGRAVLGC